MPAATIVSNATAAIDTFRPTRCKTGSLPEHRLGASPVPQGQYRSHRGFAITPQVADTEKTHAENYLRPQWVSAHGVRVNNSRITASTRQRAQFDGSRSPACLRALQAYSAISISNPLGCSTARSAALPPWPPSGPDKRGNLEPGTASRPANEEPCHLCGPMLQS